MKRIPVLVLLAVVGCSGSCKRGKNDGVATTPAPTASPAASPATSPAATTPPSADPSASPTASSAPAGDECAKLFDPPPGGQKLCDEHVMGNSAEIHWQTYAFTEPRMAVFKPYWDAASRCKVSLTTKPPLLNISRDGWRLEAYDVPGGGFPTCAVAPGPEHKSVIMISVKYDR